MPTVKFTLRDEIMKEALKVKDRLGITWREATLQGLGFTVEQPRIGRPKKYKIPEKDREQEKILEALEARTRLLIVEAFHGSCVARQVLPVVTGSTPRTSIVPVIHKSFPISHKGQLDIPKIQEGARLVAQEEDKLMLSGEHKNWKALGIQGLSTVDGRITITSRGPWPENVIEDMIFTKNDNDPRVLIAPLKIINSLNKVFWEDPEHEKPPITYANFLTEQKLLHGILASDNVYTKDGSQDSAIVFTPNVENAYLLQTMKLTVNIWNDNGVGMCVLRECVAPVIPNPKSITEITDIVS